MSKRLATDIAAFLKVNERYRSWERLPDEFLRRSRRLSAEKVVEVALDLWKRGEHRFRWAAVTLLRSHPMAFRCVRWRSLEEMGDRMGNWGDVDTFASLAGPAWRSGQISDWRVHRWARSQNRWWRRAALVSTVFLNRRSVGGRGDTGRTLAVAELLASDRDDMVVKGMSWALRELIPVDRRAVERFLRKHDDVLAARVKREVRNKLTTGLKNPRSKGSRRGNGARRSASSGLIP
ncbi:MAG: DNA alkylation repair protein [Gemmatimonadota bacterium]|nr:DNA alkylation repair protein [Gemmatimonadota bacterium]